MHKTVKMCAAALALTGMAGQASAAASSCANQNDMTAIRAAAVQQRLMVAALTCNAIQLQVHAKVGVNPFGMPRLPRQIALGEFRPKACCFDQPSGRSVIGVGIHPVGRKQPTRSCATNDPSQSCAGRQRGPQPTIGKTKIFAPGPHWLTVRHRRAAYALASTHPSLTLPEVCW